ncbi:DUF6379 domain-containing protein [Novosphingobium sp. 9]|uniref:C-glycoside deglycosidase beta subunit domain-containing protein n=1 Tax=Novosphingobium sp. 9 TaxID=2025349 RepID=UPI0021B5390D|nr:DUF6379 domain-containing protein [Novosphingobium sp. 9]
MFDKYLIDETSLRNVGPVEAPTGFAFETKLGYYRGLGLSMIEELAVSVDGVAIDRGGVTFDEFCGEGGPGPLTLDEMETAYDRRWPFGAAATISVAYPGGIRRESMSCRCCNVCAYLIFRSPRSIPMPSGLRSKSDSHGGATSSVRRSMLHHFS